MQQSALSVLPIIAVLILHLNQFLVPKEQSPLPKAVASVEMLLPRKRTQFTAETVAHGPYSNALGPTNTITLSLTNVWLATLAKNASTATII